MIDDTGSIMYSPNPDEIGQPFADQTLLNEIAKEKQGYYDGKQAMVIYEKLDLPYAPGLW